MNKFSYEKKPLIEISITFIMGIMWALLFSMTLLGVKQPVIDGHIIDLEIVLAQLWSWGMLSASGIAMLLIHVGTFKINWRNKK